MSTLNFSHLRLLAIFATVVDSGSFAAAARKLSSSRSRISEQVAALEQDMGVLLLQRTSRQLKMTVEGQRVYEQAKHLPEILQSIDSDNVPVVASGEVIITMPHDIAHKLFLNILLPFRERYPGIKITLVLDDKRLDLIDRQIDLAIRGGFPKDESVIARLIHEECLGVYASPGYIASQGAIESLADLSRCHWILLDQVNKGRSQPILDDQNMVDIIPAYAYCCDSPMLQQEMIKQGLGIGLLLPSLVAEEIKRGELVQLLPHLTSKPIVFSLVYPSRHHLPMRVRAVINFLLEARIFNRMGS